MRAHGRCMRRVLAVGHRATVAELVRRFRLERYHGMEVVGACLPHDGMGDVEGVPVLGDFSDVPLVVGQIAADTVAVLACPEMDGVALRRLAWRLEKTGTDLCVAPALMEVAGPRTTHPPGRRAAAAARGPSRALGRAPAGQERFRPGRWRRCSLLVLSPLLRRRARWPSGRRVRGLAFFRQTRVGRDGSRVHHLQVPHDGARTPSSQKIDARPAMSDGVLFKMPK